MIGVVGRVGLPTAESLGTDCEGPTARVVRATVQALLDVIPAEVEEDLVEPAGELGALASGRGSEHAYELASVG